MTPSISIFIRTYRGDREWLTYCLRSIHKFLTGHLEVVICIPKPDAPHFDLYNFHKAKVVWYDDIPGDGYVAQQECKLMADTMCSGDHIMFIDSDCFVQTFLNVGSFMDARHRPVQLIRHWAEVGEAIMWQPIVTRALTVVPTFEHMAAMPLIYDRRTFPLLRAHIQNTHGASLREYISQVTNREFSEFNLLGAFSLRYTPSLYDWRMADPATDGYPRHIRQQWSWQPGGVDRHRAEYEEILAK